MNKLEIKNLLISMKTSNNENTINVTSKTFTEFITEIKKGGQDV